MKVGVKRFALGALTAVIGASLVLSGCSGSSKPADPKPSEQPGQTGPKNGGTYVYTSIGDAKIPVPTLDADTASSFVTGFVFDALLTRDEKLDYKPGVAESYTIDQDRIYTFKLRKDVKFHDGKPLTAEDVAFTYRFIAHPKYQGVRFGDFSAIKGWKELGEAYTKANEDLKEKKIDDAKALADKTAAYDNFVKTGGITVVDPQTIKFELAEPFAPALNNLSGYGILPKHLVEPVINDVKGSDFAKKPVGSGSFKFVEWVKDDHITLERNPDWKWGLKQKNPWIDKIVIKTIPDIQANMVALETGETDYAGIQPDNYEHFKNDVKHVNVITGMQFTYTYLGYNLKNPMFSDKRVRQAITHAINRQEIVDQLLMGHGTLANGHASPVRWDYNPNVPVFTYDTAKAEKLLDEAGWVKGADGMRAKGGVKLAFEIATNNGNKTREQSAVIIQQALKKVGMEVKVNLMEWNAFLDHIDSDKKQAYILGWSLGFDPDAHSIFHTDGGFNAMTGYSNAQVDKLIEQGRTTTDQAKRKEIYGQMQNILAEEQVYTWLFFSNAIVGTNKRIGGTPKEVLPAGVHLNFEEWYVQDAKSAK